MAVGVYKYYEGLPTLAKAIVIIALVIIVFIIIFWIKKLLKDIEDKKRQKERDQEYIQDFKEYCQGKSNAGQSSYPATSYIQMADSIFAAGAVDDYITGGGTDEEAIKSVFQKMNTTCDVIQLVQAFGKRVPRTDVYEFFDIFGTHTVSKYELGGWLRIEMDDEEIEENVNNVLKNKGISYRF